jgi:hypothetical protein
LNQVCVLGYFIISVALIIFVQCKNVYPQLLFGRLVFSLGGAAASTMVTAILPTMSFMPPAGPVVQSGLSSDLNSHSRHTATESIVSDLTITPARYHSEIAQHDDAAPASESPRSTSKIAGYVGMFTGIGALIALSLFLPLPARFQRRGMTPAHALQVSYYLVAGVAFALALVCFFGFMQLQGDTVKAVAAPKDDLKPESWTAQLRSRSLSLWRPLYDAALAGFQHSDIGIGYLGGFVARASSVAISLFVPLLVNASFLGSGLCAVETAGQPNGLPDIQRRCPRAYIVAAQLTGVSQLVALLCAPLFGHASAKSRIQNLPLMLACVAGIVGYPLFATQFSPDDKDTSRRVVAFVAVCLIGISQIGAIVCSLGTLSHGVLEANADEKPVNGSALPAGDDAGDDADETLNLLGQDKPSPRKPFSSLKGSIAGVYSFYGGAAILILTKLGGSLFDSISYGAPFYIMAVFNAILLTACLCISLAKRYDRYRYNTDI